MKAWQREDFLQYFNSEWASNVDIENGRFNTVNTMASLMDYLKAESMRVKQALKFVVKIIGRNVAPKKNFSRNRNSSPLMTYLSKEVIYGEISRIK